MTDPTNHTERSMLDLLRKRHKAKKQGVPEWAYMEHVRNAAGFDATRTADAMALSLWTSRGNELHGYEVKISRSDWLRELKDPAKAEGWFDVVDRWWVVAPKGVVHVEELPAGWGLLEAPTQAGRNLVVTMQAPLLSETRASIRRPLLVPLLRAAGAALEFSPAELEAARKAAYDDGQKAAVRGQTQWKDLYEKQRQRADADRAAVREIEQSLGCSFYSWTTSGADAEKVAEVSAALALILNSDKTVVETNNRIRGQVRLLRDSADHLEKLLPHE